MRKNTYPGRYIVFEGIDGSGKSTQIKILGDFLRSQNIPFIVTIEPNKNSPVSEKLEKNLADKNTKITSVEMQVMHIRARNYGMVSEVIPSLGSGKTVISDRSFISTFAYGMAFGMTFKEIAKLHVEILGLNWIKPDIALLIDVSPAQAMKRITRNRADTSFFEKEEKLEKIRSRYLSLANKKWLTVIDGSGKPEETHDLVLKKIY